MRQLAIVFAACSLLVLGACTPTGVGDPCTPEVQPDGGFQEGETVIETSSLQCRTRACMVYNNESFCTRKCTGDGDCNAEWWEEGPGQGDIDSAYCEAEVQVGAPATRGRYCVPSFASTRTEDGSE